MQREISTDSSGGAPKVSEACTRCRWIDEIAYPCSIEVAKDDARLDYRALARKPIDGEGFNPGIECALDDEFREKLASRRRASVAVTPSSGNEKAAEARVCTQHRTKVW